jgi:hypothetical protein
MKYNKIFAMTKLPTNKQKEDRSLQIEEEYEEKESLQTNKWRTHLHK